MVPIRFTPRLSVCRALCFCVVSISNKLPVRNEKNGTKAPTTTIATNISFHTYIYLCEKRSRRVEIHIFNTKDLMKVIIAKGKAVCMYVCVSDYKQNNDFSREWWRLVFGVQKTFPHQFFS